jgi:hypothetical protein
MLASAFVYNMENCLAWFVEVAPVCSHRWLSGHCGANAGLLQRTAQVH